MSVEHPIKRSKNFLDLTGQEYGELIVVGYFGKSASGKADRWLCRCSCGKELPVQSGNLRSGHTKSCRHNVRYKTKHRMSESDEYGIWSGIRSRCFNSKTPEYPRYGGRGIVMCSGWSSFQKFFGDMGKRPTADYSIDRIDNNLGYLCGKCDECLTAGVKLCNCRWATEEQQQNNRRDNHLIEFDGRTQTLEQWSKEIGILAATIRHRFKRRWSVEKALTTPARPIRFTKRQIQTG